MRTNTPQGPGSWPLPGRVNLNPAEAYRLGWDTRGLPNADIVEAEARFLSDQGDGYWSYWLDGWMDRTRGNEYMHRLNCIDCCESCAEDKCSGEDYY